jgi:hypothetical protein
MYNSSQSVLWRQVYRTFKWKTTPVAGLSAAIWGRCRCCEEGVSPECLQQDALSALYTLISGVMPVSLCLGIFFTTAYKTPVVDPHLLRGIRKMKLRRLTQCALSVSLSHSLRQVLFNHVSSTQISCLIILLHLVVCHSCGSCCLQTSVSKREPVKKMCYMIMGTLERGKNADRTGNTRNN